MSRFVLGVKETASPICDHFLSFAGGFFNLSFLHPLCSSVNSSPGGEVWYNLIGYFRMPQKVPIALRVLMADMDALWSF